MPTVSPGFNTAVLANTANVDKDAFRAWMQAVENAILITREKLTGNRTYFVRTDGNNSNTGLANTAGGAFLTLQKAWDTILGLDLGGFTATIQCADNTYSAGISMTAAPVGGPVIIQGNTGTPANCIISAPAGSTIFNVACVGANITIQGFKFAAVSGDNFPINVSGPGNYVKYGACDFGACGSGGIHIWAQSVGTVECISNYAISGAASAHIRADGGTIKLNTKTITLTGTPAITTFAYAVNMGAISNFNVTWSGSATGTRFYVSSNSLINTFGGGASVFPGNVAGITDSAGGGVYA